MDLSRKEQSGNKAFYGSFEKATLRFASCLLWRWFSKSLEGALRDAEHLLALIPLLCSPSHPNHPYESWSN